MPVRKTRRSTSRTALAIAALTLATTTACGDGPARLGATAATARANADDLFRGLGVRFVNVQRTPKFSAARAKLSKRALSPGSLVNDTAVWTGAPTSAARILEIEGRPAGGGYQFAPRTGAAVPRRPGESRHTIRLERLTDSDYRWSTLVEHAVGGVAPSDAAAGMSAWLASFERSATDLRASLRTTLPRTSAALGRLFVLDSVRTTRLADASTVVDLRIRVEGERLKPAMPALARYVDKYVEPARYVVQLADARGGRYLDARMDDAIMTFRFRTAGGRLLALDGPARPLPDSAQLRVDAFEHFFIFDVGVTAMVGDFTMLRSATARGWTMRFRRAPKWHLPLAVKHLISGPLDRPFQDQGILFTLLLRDDGDQTLLVRQFDATVRESAIVRWLGGLGAGAADDFQGRTETEENRFIADALLALRADIIAALGG